MKNQHLVALLLLCLSFAQIRAEKNNFKPEYQVSQGIYQAKINGLTLQGNSCFKTAAGYLTLTTLEENTPTMLHIYDAKGVLLQHNSYAKVINLKLSPNGHFAAFYDSKILQVIDLNTFLQKSFEGTCYFTINNSGVPSFTQLENKGESKSRYSPVLLPKSHQKIPAPLMRADGKYNIGNSYGEIQNYSGTVEESYLHPGVDFLGNANEPVYAVADGYVKGILTTGSDLYWRVAIAPLNNGDQQEGYLYAHLNFSSITVQLGDYVTKGQQIGTLVPWPIPEFTHIHFSRISCSGQVWNGEWLTTDNSLPDVENHIDTVAPVFENCINNDRFAFINQNNQVVSSQNLSGDLDVISKCSDNANSNYNIDIYKLSYAFAPQSKPQLKIEDKFCYSYDMETDVYVGSGSVSFSLLTTIYALSEPFISTGNYDSRDYYHFVSHADNDSLLTTNDALQKFNTGNYPNGNYIFSVTAEDASKNQTTASMNIKINNTNPVNHAPFIRGIATAICPQNGADYSIDLFNHVFDETADSQLKFSFMQQDSLITWNYSAASGHLTLSRTVNINALLNIRVEDQQGLSSVFTLNILPVNAITESEATSKSAELSQNYPNPFNPTTEISYEMKNTSNVKLIIYNAKGELLKSLVRGVQSAGRHCIKFDGSNLNSGVYFYQLESDGKSITKKMLLCK